MTIAASIGGYGFSWEFWVNDLNWGCFVIVGLSFACKHKLYWRTRLFKDRYDSGIILDFARNGQSESWRLQDPLVRYR